MSKSIHFCFTINNYTDDDLRAVNSAVDDPAVLYCCYQREVGAAGTPHIQGYIQLSRRIRLSQVQGLVGGRAHVERARGSDADCVRYCSKQDETSIADSFEEFGDRQTIRKRTTPVAAGARVVSVKTSMGDVLNLIDEGANLREIIRAHPDYYARYHASITACYNLFQRKPVVALPGPWKWSLPDGFTWGRSLVLIGAAGIGKTEWAKSLFTNPLFVTHMDDLKHFDGTWHGGIIFDDMSFEHLPRQAQIHLVDIDNPRSIHVRYGCAHIPAHVKKVFTTNVENIFTNDAAINRRVLYFDCV